MKLENKKCPICRITKSIDEFYQYFSKARQKYRVSNYCKTCSKKDSNIRARIHYQQNRQSKIEYAKKYYEKNYDRQLEMQRNSKRRRRKNLALSYVRGLMTHKNKFRMESLRENAELVNLYRNRLLIKRTLKNIQNGKEQT